MMNKVLNAYKMSTLKVYLFCLFSILLNSSFNFYHAPFHNHSLLKKHSPHLPLIKHAFHTSITQIEYNTKAKSYEVSIRIFTDDLETAIDAANHKKGTKIVNGDKNDILLANYLNHHFSLLTPQNKKIALNYIGKENEELATWIYLEIADEPFVAGTKIQQNVLMELFEDQVNIVNFKKGELRKSFLFNKNSQVKNWE